MFTNTPAKLGISNFTPNWGLENCNLLASKNMPRLARTKSRNIHHRDPDGTRKTTAVSILMRPRSIWLRKTKHYSVKWKKISLIYFDDPRATVPQRLNKLPGSFFWNTRFFLIQLKINTKNHLKHQGSLMAKENRKKSHRCWLTFKIDVPSKVPKRSIRSKDPNDTNRKAFDQYSQADTTNRTDVARFCLGESCQ